MGAVVSSDFRVIITEESHIRPLLLGPVKEYLLALQSIGIMSTFDLITSLYFSHPSVINAQDL